MARALVWERDGARWPHHAASRFVEAGGLRWHVQQMGSGPVALLIHGTGASTHSWRGLMPLLAREFTVVAMDLPGHGFTGTPGAVQFSLPGMADLLGALTKALALDVALVVGHSAGAAIGARMLLEGATAPRLVGAINGAFMPLDGLPGLLFPPVARLMAATPLAAQLFARRQWAPAAVERMLRGTGSVIDAEGIAQYGMLMSDPAHAAGALMMMSRWDLQPLARDFARWRTPLAAIVGMNDRAVPPHDAQRVLAMMPPGTQRSIDRVEHTGHLVHEEQPDTVARLLMAAWKRAINGF